MTANLSFENLMQQGDISAIYNFLTNLNDINEFIYNDEETETNALHITCSTTSPVRDHVVVLLIRLNAGINHPAKLANISDMTALHLATINGFDSTIKILLNLGANVDLYDSTTRTPHCYAKSFKRVSTDVLNCFRGDFPSSLRVYDMGRKKLKIPDVDKSTAVKDKTTNGGGGGDTTATTTYKNNNNKNLGSGRGPNDPANSPKSNSSYQLEANYNKTTERWESDKSPAPTKTHEVVSSSSVSQILPPIKWKKPYHGKLTPITGPVRRIVKSTLSRKPEGFIVTLEGSDEKIKVSLDDLQKHAPVALKKYLRHICRLGGSKWIRLKEGFGQVKIKKLLDRAYPSSTPKKSMRT